ncbi:MAG: hypothetical protein RBR70_09050 [Arcobacter sp.]|uniref:hypothetical protein n=1 Tax=Arcobacter sp. TaxID=1872629 RepID=UPI002A7628E4|nr:hypothetical protein [Arcobacter sp.]MDY3205204.1 hypothetical protein [Arcobacter sp.]
MPYLVSSIMAVVAALIILLTRYEADDSAITAEIERAKSMFITIDEFANTYIQSGGDMTKINFEQLFDDGILLGNMTKGILSSNSNVKVVAGAIGDKSFTATLEFPKSNIKWQIVPIVDYKINDYRGEEIDLGKSVGAGYQLFIDFSDDSTLNSKSAFSENFLGREICEKTFFGSFINDATSISSTSGTLNQIVTTSGTSSDGKIACVVFK